MRIKDDILQSEINLAPRIVYTKTRIQNDLERLKEIYEKMGYYSAKISPKVIVLDENRVNVVFEIEEGFRAKIKNINIIGNDNYSDDLLKAKMATSENRWYKFLSGNPSFDEDRLAYDRELLRRFYLSRGYADFEVLSITSKISQDKKYFFITIKVDEGKKYKFGEIDIDVKLKNVDEEKLAKIVSKHTEIDDWYDANKIENAVLALTREIENMQYAFTKVVPSVEKDEDNQKIALTYTINEGQKSFVNQINIKGNQRTLDRVVRREFELMEGDAFNRDKLRKSERDLRNLNFFEAVKVELNPVDDGLVDIDVEVAEKSTGEISMGAGFSTEDGPLADFSISEHNFLGKGQYLKLGTVVSADSQQIDLSFTEPHFLDRDLAAGFDIYNTEKDLTDESSYKKKLTGLALRLGYPLSDYLRQKLTYRYEDSDIYDVQDDASLYIQEQEGQEKRSSITHNLVYDTRDSMFDPTQGSLLKMTNEFAGLGGKKFIKNTVGAGVYYPLSDQWIFSNYAEAGNVFGYGGEEVNIADRFFIGGRKLRGFESSGIGPRDKDTGDALGGENYVINSAELSFPLGVSPDMGIRGFTFLDAGSLWGLENDANAHDESSIRASAGIGMAWKSPMGMIKFSYAYPFMSEDYDQEEEFHFSFGTRF